MASKKGRTALLAVASLSVVAACTAAPGAGDERDGGGSSASAAAATTAGFAVYGRPTPGDFMLTTGEVGTLDPTKIDCRPATSRPLRDQPDRLRLCHDLRGGQPDRFVLQAPRFALRRAACS
jgi:hypothetical protein